MKKPRITKPRLAWKKTRKGIWEPYHRKTWEEGGKRREKAVRLDWQGDPEELDRLYWLCETGNHERQKPAPKYTWRALIEAWRSDPRIQKKLAPGTKATYRKTMDVILERNADKDVRRTTRQGVRKKHDDLSSTPRMADAWLQMVSLLWNYGAKKLDWPLGPNPASGIDKFGAQREFLPWPDWMVEKLDTAPDHVRGAAMLILGTGQRPSAAIGMRRDQFQGEWMTVLDEKQDELIEVFAPADLRAWLAGQPVRGKHVLAKNLTQPVTYDTVASAFQKWRGGLKRDAKAYSLHGLRKLAIVRLAEAGCSDAEIQAVTNQSPQTVAFYRKRASRRKLSRAAQERRT